MSECIQDNLHVAIAPRILDEMGPSPTPKMVRGTPLKPRPRLLRLEDLTWTFTVRSDPDWKLARRRDRR